jgi:curved DNA-binding protein CbpA
MNNERETFLRKINEFIIFSKNNSPKELKSNYLRLVKEYHPDKNNKIDKEILNEYMIIINNTYNEIERKTKGIKLKDKTHGQKYFDINTFCQLLETIETIYLIRKERNDIRFDEYRQLFLKKISGYNQQVGKAFSLMLSDETISGENFDTFLSGIAGYEKIFNNAYIYTEYYMKKTQKAANNNFDEYGKRSNEEIKGATASIKKWFNELVENIL